MPKYDYDLIVIGGGAAGLTASTFAGQSAAKTLLIEKEEKLGGDCLHYGCVPSKSLIKSGYAYNVIRHARKYGLPDITLPPVDFAQVRDRIQGIIATIQKHDEPDYLEKKYNVETQFGQPRFMDAHSIALNGKTMTARYFVLATGSAPFIPPIEGIEDIPYLTNVEIFSLDKLPESMIILGGGPIGMEMAQAFTRLGTRVVVVQSADQVLPKEDKDVATFVEGRLKDEGVEILLGTQAVNVQFHNNRITLTVEKSGIQSMIEAEKLLVAAGRTPNVEGLDLERAGVIYDQRGVHADHTLRTSAKHIYACGDMNGRFPFTHVASYEAVVAIYNAILKIPKKADYTHVPWCTYLDPEVASIGYNERRAKEAGIAYTAQVDYFEDNDRALAEGETKGFIKILVNKKGKPIGVQMVGYHAGDLIHEWVPVLNGKVSLSTLSGAIHAYPTMAEINKNSSVHYLVSTIPPWTKKLTKLLFGYQGKA